MTESAVAIVGSGIVGTTIAYLLANRGYDVTIFEKGPEYPYPHNAQFREKVLYMYDNPRYRLPSDFMDVTLSGNYPADLNHERVMAVGGSATKWTAITLRMIPNDFITKTLYGYGQDWPITYDDLEAYYCDAETFLGVSGTDADNPFAPRRSQPYPLPPFELSFDDGILSERLRRYGIRIHTTPQARTRNAYHGREACRNYGTCQVCPIGARYSPNHHLLQALATGRCKLHSNTSVRRVLMDRSGQANGLVYRDNDGEAEQEHRAKVIILAAGAIETPRLLLLSSDSRHPDGVGNAAGHLGNHLAFHHLWSGRLQYKEPLYPGRFGGMTGQSHQFLNAPSRGKHGGVKVEFSSHVPELLVPGSAAWRSGSEALADLEWRRRSRLMVLHAESIPSPLKSVTLSTRRDRFGDPFAHVHYESSEFDALTYRFARDIFDRFVRATEAEEAEINSENIFYSGYHHMGTCRMARHPSDGVVDEFGKVYPTVNLFLAGGSIFVGPSGAVNPTLTMVALAMRTTDYILDQIL